MTFPAIGPGTTVGDWRVDHALGIGATGIVYAAHNRHLPELQVALKVLSNPGDAQAVERLRREAALLARLDHPGIVRVRSMQMYQGHPCVVMDLARGRPLQDLVRPGGLSADQVLSVIRQLAEALAYAHQQGIAHRDIKPSNVILEVSGGIRLLDFGIATHADLTRLTAVGGFGPATPAYAAPEWFDGRDPTPQSGDMYALGVLTYELLHGRRAFSARGPNAIASLRQAKVETPYLDVGEDAPERARSMVRELTRRDPSQRLTATEASERLADERAPLAGLTSVVDRTMDAPAQHLPAEGVEGEQPTFDRYTLLEERGRGAMGIVYRAHDPHLKRDVALKLLIGGRLARGEPLDRFLNEARLAATLDHPQIVRVHEVGTHEDQLYFTMDFVDGPSLRDWLSEHERAEPQQAARWVALLARGVAYAHSQDVIHRDIKPSNVVLADGQPRLTDFGLARRLGEHRLTASRIAVGTPAYMAPELRGGGADSDPMLGDVYALGALLFELCTGADLTGHSTTSSLTARSTTEALWPRDVVTDVPRALEAIAVRATDPNPDRRFDSAVELAEHLETYLAGGSVDQRSIGPLRVLGRWAARRRTELLAGGALALGAVAVGGAAAGVGAYSVAQAHAAISASELDSVKVASSQGRDEMLELLDSLTTDEAIARAHSFIGSTYRPRGATHVQRNIAKSRDHHLSRAWLTAPTPARLHDLLTAVRGVRSYEAVLSLVPADERTPEQRWWSAVRAGELQAAAAVTELPRHAAIARQLRGTRLGPPGVAWDVDGDGLFEINGPSARERVHSFALWTGDFVQAEGRLSIRLPDQPPIEAETISPLRTAVIGDVDGDGAAEAYVGLGHFDRTLTGYRRVGEGWEPFSPSPEINAANSDVNVVIPVDLDEDGDDELVVGLGPWSAYDIRVLDRDVRDSGPTPRLRVSQRIRFGYTAAGVLLPESPKLIAMSRKADQDHNLEEAAVVMFQVVDGQLEPMAQFDEECRGLLAADVDGDGRQDVICSAGDYTVVWLRTGPTDFEEVHLPGIVVWRAVDLDGDSDAEFVGFDVHSGQERPVAWGFGDGQEAARDLSFQPDPDRTKTGIWARGSVIRHTSPSAAADALLHDLDEVAPARQDEAREDIIRWYVEAGRPSDAAAVLDREDPRRRELLIAAGDVHALASMDDPTVRAEPSVDFTTALSDAWTVHDPFAVQRDPVAGELVVAGAGTAHLLASLHLRPTEPWTGWGAVVIPHSVASNEQGSNLSVRLRRADGSTLDILVSHETSGLSGAFTCAERDVRHPSGTVTVLLSPTGTRCQNEHGIREWDASTSPPVALEFWVKDRRRLPSLPLGRIRVGAIELYNLAPRPSEAEDDRASRMVADGEAGSALSVLSGRELEGLDAATYARALAEQRQIREASVALLLARESVSPETWLGWQRLALRNPGPLRRATRLALGDDYWPALVDAWELAMISESRADEVQGSLAGELADLDMIDLDATPHPQAISTLLEWRGILAMRRGQLNAARVDIERALPLAADDPRRRRDLLVHLVEIAAGTGRMSEARERAAQAIATSPTPLLTQDRTDDILSGVEGGL